MSDAQNNSYLEALKSVVGEDNFNFAVNLLIACVEKIGKSGIHDLEKCIKNSERIALLDEWFPNLLPKEIKNFIALLSAEKKMNILENLQKLSEKNSVVVTLPAKTDSNLMTHLTDSIFKITGRRGVRFITDSEIIGGIKIKIDDLEIDNSVRTRLMSFKKNS